MNIAINSHYALDESRLTGYRDEQRPTLHGTRA